MSRYQHVIWDWNGTLLNDAGLCIDVMNAMLAERQMPQITVSRYREIFDFPVVSYYEALGFDFEEESFESLAHLYCDMYDRRVSECNLHEGAGVALGHFSAMGGRQSILSSSEQSALDDAVRNFGVAGEFASVIGQSDRYAAGKAAAGLALISSSGVPASKTVLIGDTLHDHEVAKAIGVDCILVTIGHHSRNKLQFAGEFVVDSLEEAIAYAA